MLLSYRVASITLPFWDFCFGRALSVRRERATNVDLLLEFAARFAAHVAFIARVGLNESAFARFCRHDVLLFFSIRGQDGGWSQKTYPLLAGRTKFKTLKQPVNGPRRNPCMNNDSPIQELDL